MGRGGKYHRTPPTHRFDPSHLDRLGGGVPLRLVSGFVQVPDEAFLVALVLETGLMVTAGLGGVSGLRGIRDRRWL